jgi:hypothetical protein
VAGAAACSAAGAAGLAGAQAANSAVVPAPALITKNLRRLIEWFNIEVSPLK